MRRFEKFKRLFKGRSLEVAKLPSLGPLDVGIAIVYPYKEKPNNFHMFQPF
jgi:hypothetical protein